MSVKDRGFASMDRSKQREIASKGGKTAHRLGRAHEWTSEEAKLVGRKGGAASAAKRRARRLAQSAEPVDRSASAGKDATPTTGGDTNVGAGGTTRRRTWPDSY